MMFPALPYDIHSHYNILILGDPDDLVKIRKSETSSVLDNWRDVNSLYLLNLVYDVMPSSFVDTVITELGMVPCTSVPAVLNKKA